MKCVGIGANVQMGSKAIQEFCEMDSSTKELLKAAIAQFNLSEGRMMKVDMREVVVQDSSRTIYSKPAECSTPDS